MGIRFRVTGSEVADFDERSIVNAEFLSESPKDSKFGDEFCTMSELIVMMY